MTHRIWRSKLRLSFPRRHPRGDRGSITLFVAVVSVAIMLLIALVIDGAGKLRALNHAEAAAQEAARTGAQAVDAGKAISGAGITVDRNAAQNAAVAYLRSAGTAGTVSWGSDGSINVAVTETYHPFFWPGDMTVTGRGSATLIVQGG
ncbi:Flp pilus assembly protein TadG [Kitasatospora sp. MAA19]|uniref:pilus assembly protein TadG-related protein n=1 Tax=Kitasatospora sp. MAA19 TaxID=3035090 RepID=UPI0024730202|nr:pilus assembly protein TadG-related protein [Kitasatospora sp. MAA19]MDH6710907.1 Flp pilus assembly protein TadG [Kitasatospora sp. MAA19]